jgi:hypothetical protein
MANEQSQNSARGRVPTTQADRVPKTIAFTVGIVKRDAMFAKHRYDRLQHVRARGKKLDLQALFQVAFGGFQNQIFG